jgi:Iron-containing redox enzyme
VVAQPPSMAVAALVGSQSCWIEHAHPVALLGYLVVLEGSPPSAEQLREIQERTGLPSEAFRCLLKHADEDPHHIAELNALLDRLPLEPCHTSLIAMSAFQTIETLARMFEDLLAAAVERRATRLTAVPCR